LSFGSVIHILAAYAKTTKLAIQQLFSWKM